MTPIFSVCIWSPKLFSSPLASPTNYARHCWTTNKQSWFHVFFQSMKTPANYTSTTTECKIVDKRGVKNAIKIVSDGFFFLFNKVRFTKKKTNNSVNELDFFVFLLENFILLFFQLFTSRWMLLVMDRNVEPV